MTEGRLDEALDKIRSTANHDAEWDFDRDNREPDEHDYIPNRSDYDDEDGDVMYDRDYEYRMSEYQDAYNAYQNKRKEYIEDAIKTAIDNAKEDNIAIGFMVDIMRNTRLKYYIGALRGLMQQKENQWEKDSQNETI